MPAKKAAKKAVKKAAKMHKGKALDSVKPLTEAVTFAIPNCRRRTCHRNRAQPRRQISANAGARMKFSAASRKRYMCVRVRCRRR